MKTELIEQVAGYYATKLAAHGPTPAGVDWNSGRSQELRFEQFMPLIDGQHGTAASVIDYGCGYGALLDFLRGRGHIGPYVGFDAAPTMVAAAFARHNGDPLARFVAARDALEPSDYTFASGVFNVRLDTPVDDWGEYLYQTVLDIAAVSRRGFAFNALTQYSDIERRRGDLYYANPCEVFDWCMQRWPRRVSLRHDYELYEFTVLVRF